MGQKTPPSWSYAIEHAREHVEDCGSPQSGPSEAKPLVMHIAEALHVPPAELYNPPTAVAPGRETDSGDVSERDCEALLHAYRRIRDPKLRQELLALAQEAVKRD